MTEIENPKAGTMYFDTKGNRYYQYCPKCGWIDVTNALGQLESAMFEEHLAHLEEEVKK